MSKPVADAIAAREEAKRPVVVEEPKPKRTRKKAEEPETNTYEPTVEVDYFGYAPEDDGS